ncbi:hypothetical protein B0I03_11022 [Flavobacterium aquaticum]|uniref:Uncharacterized protein n=1 Tax=Flavobacterium aquaticum TaxID=1236486 RepID=A0A327YIL3_9FLAO|nr:hypothetical protein [Flavobacterium aquaticum]RAK19595.1 hypothetical protein B0I03_11022 [Flavobacterium aquaticum]
MENYLYTCAYCGKQYKPRRRRKQKYCSNSCRTNAFNAKKKNSLVKPETNKPENQLQKIDKMSWAGVGNAAAGTLAVNALSSLLTREENKPVTKKDFKEIKELLIKRFHPISNMRPDAYGNQPYYDLETKSVVYLKAGNYGI